MQEVLVVWGGTFEWSDIRCNRLKIGCLQESGWLMVVGSQCREKLYQLTVTFLASSEASGMCGPNTYFLSSGVKLRCGWHFSPVFCFRGLCVDALIELSDENADWKLSFQEFLKCLNPAFNPPEKSMLHLRSRAWGGVGAFWGTKIDGPLQSLLRKFPSTILDGLQPIISIVMFGSKTFGCW